MKRISSSTANNFFLLLFTVVAVLSFAACHSPFQIQIKKNHFFLFFSNYPFHLFLFNEQMQRNDFNFHSNYSCSIRVNKQTGATTKNCVGTPTLCSLPDENQYKMQFNRFCWYRNVDVNLRIDYFIVNQWFFIVIIVLRPTTKKDDPFFMSHGIRKGSTCN